MTALAMADPGIGHNSGTPAEMAVAELRDSIDERRARVDLLLQSAGKSYAADATSAGKCADLVRMLREEASHIDSIRERVKRPYLEAGRAIDAEAKSVLDPLAQAKRAVEGKIDQYNREERARAEAERRRLAEIELIERERLEAERAISDESGAPIEATAPLHRIDYPTAPHIEGDLGAKVIGKTVWRHEITDWSAAFGAVSANDKVRDAINKAISAMVKAGQREIAGVRIFEDIKTEVR